jgi:hypothetical protein
MNLEGVLYSGGDTKGEVTLPLVYVGNGGQTELESIDVKTRQCLFSRATIGPAFTGRSAWQETREQN